MEWKWHGQNYHYASDSWALDFGLYINANKTEQNAVANGLIWFHQLPLLFSQSVNYAYNSVSTYNGSSLCPLSCDYAWASVSDEAGICWLSKLNFTFETNAAAAIRPFELPWIVHIEATSIHHIRFHLRNCNSTPRNRWRFDERNVIFGTVSFR